MKNLKAIALFLGVTVSVTLTSCSEEVSNPTDLSGTLTPVNISVSDFSIYMEDFSGAATRSETDPATYNGVKAMILAFYTSDGTEIYKSTQLKGSTDNFGQFSCDLPIGTYTLVVLGYTHNDGDVLDLTSPTAAAYTTERTRETFCATQSVTVTGTTALNLSVTLNRINTMLTVYSTDVRSEQIAKVRTTYSAGGMSFNPTTGLATTNTGFSIVNNISSAVGATIGIGNYAFLATDEQTMNITLEVLDDDDNVLCTKVISSVPLKRNRKTKLTGALFTPSASSLSFQLSTTYLDDLTVTF